MPTIAVLLFTFCFSRVEKNSSAEHLKWSGNRVGQRIMMPRCESDLKFVMRDVPLQTNWGLTLHNAKHLQWLLFITWRFAVPLLFLLQGTTSHPYSAIQAQLIRTSCRWRWFSRVWLLQLGKDLVTLHLRECHSYRPGVIQNRCWTQIELHSIRKALHSPLNSSLCFLHASTFAPFSGVQSR